MFKVDSRYSCPPHGAKAICGRRPKMEDAYTAVPFLLEVPVHRDRPASADLLPPRIAKEVKSAPSSANSDASDQAAETDSSDLQEPLMETLHFFGVFDGHGGAEAALHCAQTLHQRIAEALSVATSPTAHSDLASSASRTAFPSEGSSVSREDSHEGSSAPCTPSAATDPDEPAQLKSRVSSQELKAVPASPHLVSHKDLVKQTDALVDTAVLEEQEGQQDEKPDQTCSSAKFESAFADAFSRTDEEFAKADNAALIGTTAVAALVGSRHLYVANCGKDRCRTCAAHLLTPSVLSSWTLPASKNCMGSASSPLECQHILCLHSFAKA